MPAFFMPWLPQVHRPRECLPRYHSTCPSPLPALRSNRNPIPPVRSAAHLARVDPPYSQRSHRRRTRPLNPPAPQNHLGSRVHLTSRKLKPTAARKPLPKTILAKRPGKLRSRRLKISVACSAGQLPFRILALPKLPFPFPSRNAHFPALWSDAMALSGASSRKQIPSSLKPS